MTREGGEHGVKTYEIRPSARRLIGSLRDIGYDFNTAIADLVDNSIAAGAAHIEVDIRHDGPRSSVMISDDGFGMTQASINEALRFGSQRSYEADDLGRYGLGLKTASLSQCRRLTVVSRRSTKVARVVARQLDLDRIEATDRWEVTDPQRVNAIDRAETRLRRGSGTVIVWEELDRVMGSSDPDSGWTKRRLAKLAPKLEAYLGMVFHRFLAGEVPGRGTLHISVNGEKVRVWDPFASDESTIQMQSRHWELPSSAGSQHVWLNRFVLPPKDQFSSVEEFERLGGPLKWNRQQGLYIYRSHRLIQGGGWSGIRTIDEHTKLARASLEFPSALDELFHVNVAKMKVSVPPEIRTMLEAPIHELCREADAVYRTNASRRTPDVSERGRSTTVEGAGLAVRAAAMAAGMNPTQLRNFGSHLREHNPDVAALLGF